MAKYSKHIKQLALNKGIALDKLKKPANTRAYNFHTKYKKSKPVQQKKLSKNLPKGSKARKQAVRARNRRIKKARAKAKRTQIKRKSYGKRITKTNPFYLTGLKPGQNVDDLLFYLKKINAPLKMHLLPETPIEVSQNGAMIAKSSSIARSWAIINKHYGKKWNETGISGKDNKYGRAFPNHMDQRLVNDYLVPAMSDINEFERVSKKAASLINDYLFGDFQAAYYNMES